MDEASLDLRGYWRIALRWWWVIALGLAIPLVSVRLFGTLISTDPVLIYRADTKVLVEGRQTPGAPDASSVSAGRTLADAYKDFVKIRSVLQRVIETEKLPYGTETLGGKISATSSQSVISIQARDSDPARAAALANATALAFITDQRDRQFTQIASFQAALSQYGLGSDSSVVAAQVATIRTLSVLEEAVPSFSPINPPTANRDALMAAIAGLGLAFAMIFLLEHLDDTFKSPEELRAVSGLAPLGTVMRQSSRSGTHNLLTDDPKSPLAESYKFVRANIEFAGLEGGRLRTLLISSASPLEGKSTTAANLAISAAREGKSVILVDADLRRPSQHRLFSFDRRDGMSNVLVGSATLDQALVPTTVPGLRVLSAGPLPPDPTPVLRSAAMRSLVAELKERAELVIFDSGPVLAVTDPLLIAVLVDAVILVVDAHRTRRGAIQQAAAALRQANQRVLGVVFNKVRAKGRGYYYSYYYYQYDSESGRSRRPSPKLLGGLLGGLRRHSTFGERGNRTAGAMRSSPVAIAEQPSQRAGHVASSGLQSTQGVGDGLHVDESDIGHKNGNAGRKQE